MIGKLFILAESQPITTEWAAWFPVEMSIYASVGAAIAVAVWVLQQQRRANDPTDATPKAGPIGMVVVAGCTFVIGVGLAIGFTKVLANYYGIEQNAYINGIACGFGVFGVPIGFVLVKIGDWVSKNPMEFARSLLTKVPPKIDNK